MWNRIFTLIIKEFHSIWRDPKSRTLIFLPPLVQLCIFAYAATMEVQNIDMVILDKDNTVESRELSDRFVHSVWFRKIYYVENEKQFARMIESQKVMMGMEINTDFSKNLKGQKQAKVQMIFDGRQTNVAAILSGYTSAIFNQYEKDIFNPAYNDLPRVEVQTRNWFNTNLTYFNYTAVSLVATLAMVIGILLTSLSVAREREIGTFDQLIVSPLRPFEILIGKTFPPLVIATIISTMMGLFAVFIFKIPYSGSIWLFYVSTTVFLLSIVGIGLFISSICRTQQQAILGTFMFQMPAMLMSGYISPIENMPIFFQKLTFFNPIRFYMVIVKGLFFKNIPADVVFENIVPMAITAVITLYCAYWMFNRNLD
jgi:ABC-2 type transport system permease protein